MEDVDDDDDPLVDIDNCDKTNPLAVVEYIDDLYQFYKKAEVIHVSDCNLKRSIFIGVDSLNFVYLIFCSVLVVFLQIIWNSNMILTKG